MSFCTSCGNNMEAGAAFCAKCGTAAHANTAGNPVSQNNQSTLESSGTLLAESKRQAEKHINQAMLNFFFVLFCEFKGFGKAEAFANPAIPIVTIGIMAGIVYLLAVILGTKQSKPTPILAAMIFWAVINLLAFLLNDISNNNLFDWLGYGIAGVQIFYLYRGYDALKSGLEGNLPN